VKNSIVIKFLAILLAAASVVVAIGGGAGIVAMESAGLYVNGLDELQNQAYKNIASYLAEACAELYAVESLGNLPYRLKQSLYKSPKERGDAQYWQIKLRQDDTVLIEPESPEAFSVVMEYTIVPIYPIVAEETPDESAPGSTEAPRERSMTDLGNRPPNVPEGYLYTDTVSIWEDDWLTSYELYYYEAPEYTVTVYMQEKVLESSSLHILTSLHPYRYSCIAILAAGLVMFAVCMVYLFWSAGKNMKGEVHLGGLNLIPLDLYFLTAGGGSAALILLFLRLCRWVQSEGPHPGNLSLLAVNLLGVALLVIGFLFAVAAQFKVKNGYWWKHMIIGWCCGKLGVLFRILWRMGTEFAALLPTVWQWLLTAAAMVLTTVITFLLCFFNLRNPPFDVLFFLLFLLDLAICAIIVLYSGYAFGILMKGAKKMNEGDLNSKIPTKYLYGNFRELANQLNALQETAKVAAEHEMRSERMRSELITNVSHDIKTPLTSIINFVDLLQKPHSQEDEAAYLEVLSRQTTRMKKLIEDLMELSKASSGNIAVNITRLDAVEAVNQVLGEFSDKLESAGLTPVFHQPQEPILMHGDGRLVWRVLSNLLSNAVKYAMPGTRIYVDLLQAEDKVVLSLKNISQEALNISADELMERFVRGDAARKSEGSGLGLNIAKNLMEVQNGHLQLLLDGDLFKVTLIFPAA